MAETIPDVIEPASLADYFEVMTRAVFQAGVSWKQIAAHWDAYREAFANFDPARVAAYDDLDVERVLATPGVLRMPRKVRATIADARRCSRPNASTAASKTTCTPSTRTALAKDIKRRFTLMGDMNVWYFLFRTGKAVPRFESWVERYAASIRACARWSSAPAMPAARRN